MPKSSDFDYQGLSVSHAGGIDPVEANQRTFNKSASKEQKVGGFQPVKGMVSPRKRREHNPSPSQDTLDATSKAAMKDWRNKGITNNDIIDY